jgi:predicted nucleotidyltransferase
MFARAAPDRGPAAVVLPDTGSVNRQRATQLAEQLLRNLDARHDEWPVSIITAVYVFGSYARDATDPHDLDIDVEVHLQDEEFLFSSPV